MSERMRYGVGEVVGPVDREVVFLLDGVGGLQAGPLLARRALRERGEAIGSVLFRWQWGLTGEIWTDLMWLKRNRVMGGQLARRLLAFRRANPNTVVHILAISGGAGIAVFACEALRGRGRIETLVLPCPALSPTYNLGPALRSVKRCYALVSSRDTVLLGLGTRIFGTTDRVFTAAAGQVGFQMPDGIDEEDARAYQRLREIRWSPQLREVRHNGGHIGWSALPFLREHLPEILRGNPRLPTYAIGAP